MDKGAKAMFWSEQEPGPEGDKPYHSLQEDDAQTAPTPIGVNLATGSRWNRYCYTVTVKAIIKDVVLHTGRLYHGLVGGGVGLLVCL